MMQIPAKQRTILTAAPLLIGTTAAVAFAILVAWSPLAAVGFLAGAGVLVVAWKRPFWLLAFLVLALPFHVFATRAMVGQLGLGLDFVERFAYWKEAAMALLAVILLLRRVFARDHFRIALYPFDWGLLCVALIMGTYVFVGPRLDIGIYGLRNYLEPLVVFYLVRCTPITRPQLRWLVIGMATVIAMMAVFGIYQVRVWTFDDLYNWGFREADGSIPHAFYTAEVEKQPHLRAVGTVTSPNELGLMLVLGIALATVFVVQNKRVAWQRAALVGVIAVYGIALLYTYSRSSLVGLAVMAGALALLEIGVRNLGKATTYILHRPDMLLAAFGIVILLFVGAERVGLMARITRAISLDDPSAVGHLASYQESIPFIFDHPFGIGMGLAGPRALKFADQLHIEHVESSWMQMMMEIGIAGTLFVFGVMLLMVWTLRAQRRKQTATSDEFARAVSIAVEATWLGALVAFTFLPLMQELQLMSYLWIAAAIPLVATRLEKQKPT